MAIEDRGPQLRAVVIALLVLAGFALALRCYVRSVMVRNFGLDDWAMVAAYIFFVLFASSALVGVHYGTGQHYWDLELIDMTRALKYWWLCYMWYCSSMIASKISIGWFLLRITVRRIDIWIIYTVMTVTVLTGVAFFFITLFQCRPVTYFWTRYLEGYTGHCITIDAVILITYIYSAFSVVCDFTFAILPIVMIFHLKMDTRSKIALAPIMALACLASCAVVIRFRYVGNFRSQDFLWATVDIAIWSTAEQALAITAGSLATLRPLFRLIGHSVGSAVRGVSSHQVTDQPIPTSTPGIELKAPSASSSAEVSGRRSKKDKYNISALWTTQNDTRADSEEELTLNKRDNININNLNSC